MIYWIILLIGAAGAAWWVFELRRDDGRISEETRDEIGRTRVLGMPR